jgi:hypothetical protein
MYADISGVHLVYPVGFRLELSQHDFTEFTSVDLFYMYVLGRKESFQIFVN